jgi:hypothetical protein
MYEKKRFSQITLLFTQMSADLRIKYQPICDNCGLFWKSARNKARQQQDKRQKEKDKR